MNVATISTLVFAALYGCAPCPPYNAPCLMVEIVDRQTQQPITRADVSVQRTIPQGSYSVSNPERASYVFPLLCRGSFELRISHPSYQLYQGTHQAMPEREYSCNERIQRLHIDMDPR